MIASLNTWTVNALTTGHHQAASQTNQTIHRNITWKRTFTGDCWLWEPGVPVLSEWLSPVLCWPCSAWLVTPPGGLLSTIAMLLTASLPGFLLHCKYDPHSCTTQGHSQEQCNGTENDCKMGLYRDVVKLDTIYKMCQWFSWRQNRIKVTL